MKLKMTVAILFLTLSTLSTLSFTNSHLGPVMPPFFFLCHYHSASEQHTDQNSGEVALSVAMEDTPNFYEPGKLYKVTVSSTSDFDGFMMTGLYTLPENVTERLVTDHLQPRTPTTLSHNVMCAVVHSQMSYRPRKSLSFMWIAPPTGTGCVDFLATGTLGHRVIFKDILALQICEKGSRVSLPSMAAVNRDGVLLRDDFEGALDGSKVWTALEGGHFGVQCGSILNGNAATFCTQHLPRYLISVPFNVSSRGAVLQFVLSSGRCNDSFLDPPLQLMIATGNCENWNVFETIKLPRSGEKAVHIAHLPVSSNDEIICIKWFQPLPEVGLTFTGCWAIDNVLVVHTNDHPKFLYDDFYPNELGNWLFLPGAEIKKSCFSKGNALVFRGQSPEKNFATTRDLNLMVTHEEEEDIVLQEEFDDFIPPENWLMNSASPSEDCGVVSKNKAVVFSGHGERMLCTPFIEEAGSIGNLRFHFVTGDFACGKRMSQPDGGFTVSVYAEKPTGQIFHLDEIIGKNTKAIVPVEISIPILPGLLRGTSRFCWKQDDPQNGGENVWAVDGITILPWMQTRVSHVIQFSINLQCGGVVPNNSVSVEFSNDRGLRWTNLVPEPCLPPGCPGKTPIVFKSWWSSTSNGWERVTLPVPYAARGQSVRFRFRQDNDEAASNWAIDNVYVGPCHRGCSGRGSCSSDGCSCDAGFSGKYCEVSPKQPSHFSETFPSEESLVRNRNFLKISSAVLGYQCGVLGRGRALVFNGPHRREATTRDFNTLRGKYLEMSLRVGSSSTTNGCPAPKDSSGNVYVHHSCDGGLLWFLMHAFDAGKHSEATRVSLNVPDTAQGPSCRFRIWQPVHSGYGRDVWAVDDVVLGGTPTSSISVDFEDDDRVRRMTSSHLGRVASYCGVADAFVFSDGLPNDGHRFLEMKAVPVGPQTMVQFELAINCPRKELHPQFDSHITLEFSTNHGEEWRPVHKQCSVPVGECGGSSSKGTIYDTSEYPRWRRVTILLPRNTWSDGTRLRLVQRRFLASDSWAVDNVYVGPSCPNLCSGHGRCYDGKCRCDEGFLGTSCVPKEKMATRLKRDFEVSTVEELRGSGYEVDGGLFVSGGEGCGTISSGRSLYFNQSGTRQLVTPEMDTSGADAVKFFVRIGGGSPILCGQSTNRNESVLLQYSKNSGVDWHLIKELSHDGHRRARFLSVTLPEDAKSGSSRLRWWQPQHGGEGRNQWALDDVLVDKDTLPTSLHVDSLNMTSSASIFLFRSKMRIERHCGSEDEAFVFETPDGEGQEPVNFAMTPEARLSRGDVIQFKMVVGCGQKVSPAVEVEYSKDSGDTWSLVRDECYPASGRPECESKRHEASVFHHHLHSRWTLVVLRVGKDATSTGKVTLRWMQQGPGWKSFAIKDLYVGKPCRNICFGNGVCTRDGVCKCDHGFEGHSCENGPHVPKAMMDRFNDDGLSHYWENIVNGVLGKGCGVISTGTSLYFSGPGPRLARTMTIDTRNIRHVEFILRLGEKQWAESCRPASSRNASIIFQYTTTNGVIWQLLKEMEVSGTVRVTLPTEAKLPRVSFRWWQPDVGLGPGGRGGEWALDDVLIAANDTNDVVFEDRFAELKMANWYSVANAKTVALETGNCLLFSGNEDAATRFAETWDLAITETSFIQFDLNTGLGRQEKDFDVVLEYSLDSGATWSSLVEECLPPEIGCHGYTETSVFNSEMYSNWTRITMAFSPGAISRNTRFKWTQRSDGLSSEAWALARVFVGQGCPWLCSGHGYCESGQCRCDNGYGPPYCTPIHPLPSYLRETFDTIPLNGVRWPWVFGGQVGHRCSRVVNGMAFTFYKNGTRMLTSQDLDLSNARFLEFTVKMGCGSKRATSNREKSVIVQYSNNGGITWKILKEIPYSTEDHNPYKVTVLLQDVDVKTNSTRFRFWQPRHGGLEDAEWAVDSIYVGGMLAYPNVLHDTFDGHLRKEAYIDWPGSHIGVFCNRSGLAFDGDEDSTRALHTLDIEISSDTIVQFDIKVGCGGDGSSESPVLLEYSANEGISWSLIRGYSDKVLYTGARGTIGEQDEPTVYFDVGTLTWQSLVIPLRNLHICGHTRFRWRQLDLDVNEAPSFGLSNLYIGPACRDECSGELGKCHLDSSRPSGCHQESSDIVTVLKANFEGDEQEHLMWDLVIGGEISKKCGGVLASGSSLVFKQSGHRMLVTKQMDLSSASSLQFYLRLGCGGRDDGLQEDLSSAEAVLLQFSQDKGMSWQTLEEFPFGVSKSGLTTYVTLDIPHTIKLPSVQLRWWQPSSWGKFTADWAIDQIHVTSDHSGTLNDYSEAAWIEVAGGVTKPVCERTDDFLHFSGTEGGKRYAVTADVAVDDDTYIQFDLAMGCEKTSSSYNVELQFSTDTGKSWKRLIEPCPPSYASCTSYGPGSVYTADEYNGVNRIGFKLPYYTWSTVTRFRWIQLGPYRASETWSLGKVYVGDQCPVSCANHGHCTAGGCKCEDGWHGDDCTTPKSPLTGFVSESFSGNFMEDKVSKSFWRKMAGGSVSSLCGQMGYGTNLHFYGHYNRLLESRDLDLSNGTFISFYFKFGCLTPPTTRDSNVFFQVSTPTKPGWVTLKELDFKEHKVPSYIVVVLPKPFKVNGVKLRWWQSHEGVGGQGRNDWAIDEVIVGNSNQKSIWLRKQNEPLNSTDAALDGDGSFVLETVDLRMAKGDILQFEMVTTEDSTSPIDLQFSTDFGFSWHHLINPSYPEAFRSTFIPTRFYPPFPRRRFIVPLPGNPSSEWTRFRWIQQVQSSVSGSWTVDGYYVGPSCHQMCSYHGKCADEGSRCHCDEGFGGRYCQESHGHRGLTNLKETFEGNYDRMKFLVTGGHIGVPCVPMKGDMAVVFDKKGGRSIETVDLDLSDAKFIQFVAVIGGHSGTIGSFGCKKAVSKQDNVFLGFSLDSGISWELIHELDFASYHVPRFDYILLPAKCRTSRTRFRWWQMDPDLNPQGPSTELVETAEAASWALDDVFIGGQEINEDRMTTGSMDIWWFHPYGEKRNFFCGKYGDAMVWNKSSTTGQERSLTTRELIVGDGYILQFKLAIGCDDVTESCNDVASVLLEYSTDPASGRWSLVEPSCYPGNNSRSGCNPNNFHMASAYGQDVFKKWTRVVIPLPSRTFSGSTQFRWIQRTMATSSWAVSEVYIGPSCPHMCNGFGECTEGRCVCDPPHKGERCEVVAGVEDDSQEEHESMKDDFESEFPQWWSEIYGGKPSKSCGSMAPNGHGVHLRFDKCGARMAITDVQVVTRVSFVIKIGCGGNLTSTLVDSKSVLLQYSEDNGIRWKLIAGHHPKDYSLARRVEYDVPRPGQRTRLRWWQPNHDGHGRDTWALDNVEIFK